MRLRWRVALGLVVAFVAGAGVGAGAARFGGVASRPAPRTVPPVPGPGTETYREMVGAFYGGVAALNANKLDRAQTLLEHATELASGEPAAWANLGLVESRRDCYHEAEKHLEVARALAPESAAIERLLARLGARRGGESIAHWRRVIELEPGDLEARFELAQEIEREAGLDPGPEWVAEPIRLMEEILQKQPDNLAVLLNLTRLAVKRADAKVLGTAIERLGRLEAGWPARAREVYATLRAETDPRPLSVRVVFLKNLLVRTSKYQFGLAVVMPTPSVLAGEPIQDFLRMTPPKAP